MQIRITSLTEQELPAVHAFNLRIAANAPFFLPEGISHPRPNNSLVEPAISWTHYLAMEGLEVRGGFLLMEQPAVVEGQVRRVCNSQSMLSEGICDRKYGVVSLQMLKYIERNKEYPFMVGMGSMQASLPRLLMGAGWTVRAIPFLFRIQNVRKFLYEMRVFRDSGYRQAAAQAASVTGAGWLGAKLLQWRPMLSNRELRGLTLTPITTWGAWADEIWSQYERHCSFAVLRDRSTLQLLYPLNGDRVRACVVHYGSRPVGWAAWLNTPMQNDKYFGNLHVVTILDCIAPPEYADIVAHLIADHVSESQADLLISNQAHSLWVRAFRRSGFLTASSNYLLATSRKFSAAIQAGGGEERLHLTRGDSDGRIHL
jgi:hypothetical protein